MLKEIKLLEQKSQDLSTLIEHSPYCFGKILDYLRLTRLHSLELIKEPSLPSVCESQMERYTKVVKYYFPGESSRILLPSILDSAKAIVEETRLDSGKSLNDAVIEFIRDSVSELDQS